MTLSFFLSVSAEELQNLKLVLLIFVHISSLKIIIIIIIFWYVDRESIERVQIKGGAA